MVALVAVMSMTWSESGWPGRARLGKPSDAAAVGDDEVSIGDELLLPLTSAPRLGVRVNENRDNDERRRGKNRKFVADELSVPRSESFGLMPSRTGLGVGIAADDGERESRRMMEEEEGVEEVVRSSLGSES